jgi:hypothetical protein
MKITLETAARHENFGQWNKIRFFFWRHKERANCALHMRWIIISPMIRIVTFLLAVVVAAPLVAQIPPGDAFDPAKHINPIVTFVLIKDFQASNYKDAGVAAGMPLLGFSKETANLETVELAQAGIQNVKQGRNTMKVTFYPVVRQTFKLADGTKVILHSFKNPRIPNNPFGDRGRDPKFKRFGDEPAPEEVEIRDTHGWMFEKDGSVTVGWLEDGVFHTATSSLPRRSFFRILEDLL